jgi:polysaccharide biosynthesis protein PslH
MKEVLFLAHRIPYPPDRGDKMRSWHLLRYLAEQAVVHVGCFGDDRGGAAHVDAMRAKLGARLGEVHVERRPPRIGAVISALARNQPLSVGLFASPTMSAFVRGLVGSGRIGTIFAFSGQMAQFVPDPTPCRFVMDFVDTDSAKFAEYADKSGWPASWLYRREARLLAAFEQKVAARADTSLFVSDAEAALFRRQSPVGAEIRAIGNGIDIAFYDPGARIGPLEEGQRGGGPLIVFTGQMDYRPNVEAVTAFAHDVMPLVRQGRGDVRFAIVGRNPSAQVRSLGRLPGVAVTGAVDDVRSWLAAADVVVAPLGIARGVQNKVLEAMAMARPVVASRAAFEGIDAEPGRDLLVAEGAQSQAQAVLSLLADRDRAVALGAAARKCIENRYRWRQRLAGLEELLGLPAKKAAA